MAINKHNSLIHKAIYIYVWIIRYTYVNSNNYVGLHEITIAQMSTT